MKRLAPYTSSQPRNRPPEKSRASCLSNLSLFWTRRTLTSLLQRSKTPVAILFAATGDSQGPPTGSISRVTKIFTTTAMMTPNAWYLPGHKLLATPNVFTFCVRAYASFPSLSMNLSGRNSVGRSYSCGSRLDSAMGRNMISPAWMNSPPVNRKSLTASLGIPAMCSSKVSYQAAARLGQACRIYARLNDGASLDDEASNITTSN